MHYREIHAGVELDYTSYLKPRNKVLIKQERNSQTHKLTLSRSVSLQAKWKTQKLLQEYLEKEHDIVVSNAILRKIKTGSY